MDECPATFETLAADERVRTMVRGLLRESVQDHSDEAIQDTIRDSDAACVWLASRGDVDATFELREWFGLKPFV